MNVSPWLGAILVALGCGAAVAFHFAHLDAVTLPTLIVTSGVAVFQAQLHARTKKELVQLRESIRPPSLVDEKENISPP